MLVDNQHEQLMQSVEQFHMRKARRKYALAEKKMLCTLPVAFILMGVAFFFIGNWVLKSADSDRTDNLFTQISMQVILVVLAAGVTAYFLIKMKK